MNRDRLCTEEQRMTARTALVAQGLRLPTPKAGAGPIPDWELEPARHG